MKVKHFRIYQGTGFFIFPQSQVESQLNYWLETADDIEEIIYIYHTINNDANSNEWHHLLVLYEEKKRNKKQNE